MEQTQDNDSKYFDVLESKPRLQLKDTSNATSPDRGVKNDNQKPPLDLIDPHFEQDVAEVLGYGAMKYELDNWKKGMAVGKLIAGVRRHLNALQRGEYMDPETGFQHMAHAACGIMFLHYQVRTGMVHIPDDRWDA